MNPLPSYFPFDANPLIKICTENIKNDDREINKKKKKKLSRKKRGRITPDHETVFE
jgi:hypothetical protein